MLEMLCSWLRSFYLWGSLHGLLTPAILKLERRKGGKKVETIVVLNIKEILEEATFRRKIKALGTYKCLDEKIEAMLAQKQRDMVEDPDDFLYEEWPED